MQGHSPARGPDGLKAQHATARCNAPGNCHPVSTMRAEGPRPPLAPLNMLALMQKNVRSHFSCRATLKEL